MKPSRSVPPNAQPSRKGATRPADDAGHEAAVDLADDRIGEQVGRVARAAPAGAVREQPADVGVGQAAQRSLPAGAVVDVRAVRIAGAVRERVVLAMVGDPRDDRALDRRRAQGGEDAAHERRGLERPVREHAVKADRDAEPGQHVHDQEDPDVVPAQPLAPDLPADDQQAEHRQDRHRAGDDPVTCLVLARLDVVDAGSVSLHDSCHLGSGTVARRAGSAR